MRQYFWEASLTGDLVCGYCGKTRTVVEGETLSAGTYPCQACKENIDLLDGVIRMAELRARAAFPSGRPPREGMKWKGG